MWEVVSAIIGTLVGGLIGAIAKPLDIWFYAPKLNLDCANDDLKYIIFTQDAVTMRVAVRNDGRGTAKSVRVLTTRLVLQTLKNGEQISRPRSSTLCLRRL